MKAFLLFCTILLICTSFIQKEFEYNKRDVHSYRDATGQYLLIFEYDTTRYENVAIYPNRSIKHFDSFVTVYRKSGAYIYIMKFKCIYTDGLCYEDNPKKLIERAKKIQLEQSITK